jgi:hypothetical protein
MTNDDDEVSTEFTQSPPQTLAVEIRLFLGAAQKSQIVQLNRKSVS